MTGAAIDPEGPFHPGNYHTLPTNPDELLRRVFQARYPEDVMAMSTRPGRKDRPAPPKSRPATADLVFDRLGQMLQHPLPPKLRAAIYRALPKLPGVTLGRNLRDAAGRPGMAFTLHVRAHSDTTTKSIIVDPKAYRLLGTRREIANGGYTSLGPWDAYLEQKIVDNLGQGR